MSMHSEGLLHLCPGRSNTGGWVSGEGLFPEDRCCPAVDVHMKAATSGREGNRGEGTNAIRLADEVHSSVFGDKRPFSKVSGAGSVGASNLVCRPRTG